MSDFLKKVKGLFVVEEEGGAGKKSGSKSNSNDTKPKKASSTRTVKMRGGGDVSEKFMNIFLQAMDSNNLDGFDYLEFKQSLNNLESMQMTEATKYKSAFAMAKTMGVTTEKLVQSANHYLEILSNEDKKFQAALAKQRAKQIGNRESEITELGKLIEEKKKQIAQLQKDIAAHEKTMAVRKKEIDQSTSKVEKTNADFQVTYKSIVGQIEKDVKQIKQYLT